MHTLPETLSNYQFSKGHFVITTNIVEDVLDPDRQKIFVTSEHDRAHRGISEVEHQLRRSYLLIYNTVHSATGFTPNELLFNNSDSRKLQEILGNGETLFSAAQTNM